MKNLAAYIDLLAPRQVLHYGDVPLAGIACQPEEAQPGCLYGVIDEFLEYGHWTEGAQLLNATLANRAGALLTECPLPWERPQLIVQDGRKALARAARFCYDYPDRELGIVGVTGTNGKTTVTHLLDQWLSACGRRSAALGTLGLYQTTERRQETIYTTPLAPTLFRLLREVRAAGVEWLAMEISSHALALDRVYGLDVDVAVFTNLSRDHLDFHGTLENYQAAKCALFTGLRADARAVINNDDAVGKAIALHSTTPVLDYGFAPGATLQALQVDYSLEGTRLELRYEGRIVRLATSLVGAFNVYNLLAALGAGLAVGIPLEQLVATSHVLHSVPGRWSGYRCLAIAWASWTIPIPPTLWKRRCRPCVPSNPVAS